MLINFEVLCKPTKEEYLIVHLSNSEGIIEPNENENNLDIVLKSSSPKSGSILKFHISEDFNIVNNHDNKIEFRYNDRSDIYPLSVLNSIGFIIEDDTCTSIVNINSKSLDHGWRIYTIDGELIDFGEEGEPSLFKLKRGKPYIIVGKDKKYKYLPLK